MLEKKKSGPRINPCGTPDIMTIHSDSDVVVAYGSNIPTYDLEWRMSANQEKHLDTIYIYIPKTDFVGDILDAV